MRYIRGTKCKDGDKLDLNTPVAELEAGCLIHNLPFKSKVITFMGLETTLYWCLQCDEKSMLGTAIVCRGESESFRKVMKESQPRNKGVTNGNNT
jgi:hypothetical protein